MRLLEPECETNQVDTINPNENLNRKEGKTKRVIYCNEQVERVREELT